MGLTLTTTDPFGALNNADYFLKLNTDEHRFVRIFADILVINF